VLEARICEPTARLLSSLADPAYTIARFGLGRVLRDG
jgi:hypothetical protein